MGLDQYAYKVKMEDAVDPFKFDENKYYDGEDWYWRKNWNLERWMEAKYYQKAARYHHEVSKEYGFNDCVIRLSLKDILELQEDVRKILDRLGKDEDYDNGDYADDYALAQLEQTWRFAFEAEYAIRKDKCAIYYGNDW